MIYLANMHHKVISVCMVTHYRHGIHWNFFMLELSLFITDTK
ncbi:hypothetical protein HMPREF0536_10087 [Limosilactobacillus reuteri MM4-1A]|nr:hypothetical protein HMPREF0536_10087 [Limosilactobacillus reuteri MM4-1A]